MNRISVEGIKVYAFHGCMEEEADIGQHYEVDVYIDTDFFEAAQRDDLGLTIDYVAVKAIVEEEMSNRAKLIEKVSYKIAERLKTLGDISRVEVKVCKPAPPIDGDVKRVCTTVTL